MSLAEQGKRSGLKRQATGLISSFASLAPGTLAPGTFALDKVAPGTLSPVTLTIPAPDSTEKTAAKPGATLLNRRKSLRLVGDKRPDTLAQAIETSLARELELVRAEIAQQKPRYPAAAATSRRFPAVAAAPRPAASAASPVQERRVPRRLRSVPNISLKKTHCCRESSPRSRRLPPTCKRRARRRSRSERIASFEKCAAVAKDRRGGQRSQGCKRPHQVVGRKIRSGGGSGKRTPCGP
jgi:hypothetical protein